MSSGHLAVCSPYQLEKYPEFLSVANSEFFTLLPRHPLLKRFYRDPILEDGVTKPHNLLIRTLRKQSRFQPRDIAFEFRGKDRVAGWADHDPGFGIFVRNVEYSPFVHLLVGAPFGIARVTAPVGRFALRSNGAGIEGGLDGPSAFIYYWRSLRGYPVVRRSVISGCPGSRDSHCGCQAVATLDIRC